MDFSQIHWIPTIGDPTPMGWLTVLAYFATALLCWRAAQAPAPGDLAGREVHFWHAVAAAFVLLGINKQLDLQVLLTETARVMARAQGWFERRREFQFEFVIAIAVVALVAGAGLYRWLRHCHRMVRAAALGVTFTLAFVVLRASSFHHVDAMINARIAGLRGNWILELTGIGIVAAAALAYRRTETQPLA